MDWTGAACYGRGYEMFPPDSMRGSVAAKWYRETKGICEELACPIIAKCLDYAMTTEEESTDPRAGVWGGTSPADRYDLHEKRNVQWIPRQRDSSTKNSDASQPSGLTDAPKLPDCKGQASSSPGTVPPSERC